MLPVVCAVLRPRSLGLIERAKSEDAARILGLRNQPIARTVTHKTFESITIGSADRRRIHLLDGTEFLDRHASLVVLQFHVFCRAHQSVQTHGCRADENVVEVLFLERAQHLQQLVGVHARIVACRGRVSGSGDNGRRSVTGNEAGKEYDAGFLWLAYNQRVSYDAAHSKAAVKTKFMQLPGGLDAKTIFVLAAISLLFPSSARVLCIAPGLHVQEEDINAPCPAASDVFAPIDYHPADGFNAAAPWHCTDILLTPYGRGAVFESGAWVLPHFPIDECLAIQSFEACFFPLEQPVAENMPPPCFLDGSAFAAASDPLRC